MLHFSNHFEPLKDDPLVDWIMTNEKLIDDGAASYEGERITRETLLTRYQMVGSLIFLTMRTNTPWCVAGSESAQSAFVRCTAVTSIIGWWSLFGLFYTPNALFTNLTGGTKRTVAQLIDDIREEAKPKKKPHPIMQWVPLMIFPLGILVAFGLIVVYTLFLK